MSGPRRRPEAVAEGLSRRKTRGHPVRQEGRTLRKQYHLRRVGSDTHVWDVHKLIRAAGGLARITIPVDHIAEADENWWYQDPDAVPTPRSLARHMALVQGTDLSYPVILCADGRLMDGMHRVVKAVMENREHIQAIRFPVTPAPDYRNVSLEDLPYPDEDI
jgi:hypothetical protein